MGQALLVELAAGTATKRRETKAQHQRHVRFGGRADDLLLQAAHHFVQQRYHHACLYLVRRQGAGGLAERWQAVSQARIRLFGVMAMGVGGMAIEAVV